MKLEITKSDYDLERSLWIDWLSKQAGMTQGECIVCSLRRMSDVMKHAFDNQQWQDS